VSGGDGLSSSPGRSGICGTEGVSNSELGREDGFVGLDSSSNIVIGVVCVDSGSSGAVKGVDEDGDGGESGGEGEGAVVRAF